IHGWCLGGGHRDVGLHWRRILVRQPGAPTGGEERGCGFRLNAAGCKRCGRLEKRGGAPMTIRFFRKFQPRDSSGERDNIETAATTSVEIAQCAMADPSGAGLAPLVDALQDIVQHEAWRRDTAVPSGELFASFGQFAIAEAPYGLGVRSTPSARLLR